MKKGMTISYTIFNGMLTIASFISYVVKQFDCLFWLSMGFFVLQILTILFCIWIWRVGAKIPFLKCLLPPDLNGKYTGTIKSSFDSATKEIELTIKQNLYGIKVISETNQIISETMTSEIINNSGICHIIYSYKTNTKQKNDETKNPESCGTADLICNKDKLEGKYWTSNKTTGKLSVKKMKK